MTAWVDAQLPPKLAGWLTAEFGVSAVAVRDLALERATDSEISALLIQGWHGYFGT